MLAKFYYKYEILLKSHSFYKLDLSYRASSTHCETRVRFAALFMVRIEILYVFDSTHINFKSAFFSSWCIIKIHNWVCHFPIGILGQVCYLIVSIPDLCTITYF